jgi:hypothetical protein
VQKSHLHQKEAYKLGFGAKSRLCTNRGFAPKLQSTTRRGGLFRTKLLPLVSDPDFWCKAMLAIEIPAPRVNSKMKSGGEGKGCHPWKGDLPPLHPAPAAYDYILAQ